jgi:hypothetical protein
MRNKIIKSCVIYYSFCVLLSVLHFTAPRFDQLSEEQPIAKTKVLEDQKKYLANKIN